MWPSASVNGLLWRDEGRHLREYPWSEWKRHRLPTHRVSAVTIFYSIILYGNEQNEHSSELSSQVKPRYLHQMVCKPGGLLPLLDPQTAPASPRVRFYKGESLL